jgi:hypothetical protein
MDPTIFLAFGEDAVPQTAYAQRLLGSVETRPAAGHDGKFFFIQANDPLYLHPEQNAAYLDRPAYRSQRMLFPLVAGGFGLFPPAVIVWAMLAINVLCLGIGAFIAARIATIWGASPWIGLSVPLNVGLIFEVFIGGSGVLAYLCCLGAVYALVVGREWAAAALLAAAALSREAMVAFPIGIFVLVWIRTRKFAWSLVVVPLLAVATWQVYLRFRLARIPGSGGAWPIFAPPFVGMYRAFRYWITDPSDLLLNLAMVIIVAAFLLRSVESRLSIVWGALPFIALSTVLSEYVWREPFDISRALAPVFTAAVFLLFVPRGEGTLRLRGSR